MNFRKMCERFASGKIANHSQTSNVGPSANGPVVRFNLIACATLVTALFFVSSASAQGGMRGDTAAMRQRMEAQLAKMKTDLNLTQTQCDSVKAIQNDRMAGMRQIFMDPANQGLSPEDRRAKMQPLNDAMNARLNAALGAETAKKVQDWMQANRPQRGGGGNR